MSLESVKDELVGHLLVLCSDDYLPSLLKSIPQKNEKPKTDLQHLKAVKVKHHRES